MNEWLRKNAQEENRADYTDEQFLFKARKKAWGPFKRAAWDLPAGPASEIDRTLEDKFRFYIDKLGVAGSRDIVARHVKPPRLVQQAREPPASLVRP